MYLFLNRLFLDLVHEFRVALNDEHLKNTFTKSIKSDNLPGYKIIKTTEAFSESAVQLQVQLYIIYAGYGPGNRDI